jgi:hypothetical protein
MGETAFASGRDIVLYVFPLAVLLVISVFKLDDRLITPKKPAGRRGRPCPTDENGEPILRDPDGRLSARRDRRR